MSTDRDLTAPIIAKATGAGGAELKAWLKELIGEGAITTDRNADNKLVFCVPKKPRAAQIKKLKALKAKRAAAAGESAEPAPAKPQKVTAERKRDIEEAEKSLEDRPLTQAEMDKLMALTAAVSKEVEQTVDKEAEQRRAAIAAKQAELAEAEAALKDAPEAIDDEPPPQTKKQAKPKQAKPKKAKQAKKAKKAKAKKKDDDGPDALDKLDTALAVYEALDRKPAKRDDDDDDEDKPKKRGLLARIRGKFGARDALEIAGQAREELEEPKEPHEKSILFSGGLSLLLGPLGWNYAGSFRESLPASVVWLGAAALVKTMSLFSFVLMPAFFAGMAVSGVVGMVYAWQFNKHGHRVRLLGDGEDKKDDE